MSDDTVSLNLARSDVEVLYQLVVRDMRRVSNFHADSSETLHLFYQRDVETYLKSLAHSLWTSIYPDNND